jgi:multidrug resistance efflux pump
LKDAATTNTGRKEEKTSTSHPAEIDEAKAAKLEASKQEIVSKIEGEEAKLKVTDSEQKLREAEQKQKSDRAVAKATIESKVQASQKALYDVQRAERALAQMILRAPAAGTISLVQLWRPDGQAAFKPGDRAWPGAPMAELPDMSTLRVISRVDETERGRLQTSQLATVQLDAIPDIHVRARIAEELATMTTK